ncbi:MULTISPECIES: MarR family winged helix-turn-helix transcriptional regulator [Alteromonas]|uniref:Transcriptional regulator n=2 Tax=Alteromonas mediterranea TaxID=314275 RepID=A0AAC9J8X3_9ALTE|nr:MULTISPECIES: MarR family transcriptional regulator [Alteromonas]MBR9783306.1 MarR family transcriptional regulator [Gammaproteobacteria bacterium]MDY6884481.1 MarR family transcriptional regulator [Pseudomonadota bacterium]APD89245.1 transcriptional regulator [Alteromonas mediterranea]MBR9896697.1 MarR family transcriptional regulator [Gammaproteobacteria bacterium]MEA3380990.1 MarR family transcriptional regulator [Pseudomonadota bacterium]
MMFSEPMPLHLIALFARTSRRCRKTVTKFVAHLDLTESRWRVMIHMALLGEGCTQQTLAESLEIEMPSLTRTIKQLETAGLIKRIVDDKDKRSRLLYFTPMGKGRMNDIESTLAALRDEVYAGIPDDELNTVALCLKKIEQNAVRLLEASK